MVGLVEGVVEATASLLKLVSGRLADKGWNHKRMLLGGYDVSNTARPLIGLALGWGWVLVLRFLDRVGKGIRISPWDALAAASTATGMRGRAFGFHRAPAAPGNGTFQPAYPSLRQPVKKPAYFKNANVRRPP